MIFKADRENKMVEIRVIGKDGDGEWYGSDDYGTMYYRLSFLFINDSINNPPLITRALVSVVRGRKIY